MTPTPTDAAVASLPRFNAYVRFDGKVHLEEEDNGSLVMWKHVAALRNPEADAGGGKAGRAEFVKGYLLASMAHAHSSLKIETLERHADLAADKAGYAPQPTTPPAVEGGP